MRRVTLVLAAMAMMVALFAVVAYAAGIKGTDRTEEIYETNRSDQIHALQGDDEIYAQRFNSESSPDDEEKDRAHGNKGDDYINVFDGDRVDIAYGGEGTDYCDGDTGDEFPGCEFVNGDPVD